MIGGGLVVLLIGGLLAAGRGVSPEWQGLSMNNDTKSSVLLFDCDDASCNQGTNAIRLAAGHSTEMTENADDNILIGMADPTTHQLLGCTTIQPSGDHDLSTTVVHMSMMPSCGVRVRVKFHSVSG